MEKRYESDMTRKEKRQNELKKLKSMTFKQLLDERAVASAEVHFDTDK